MAKNAGSAEERPETMSERSVAEGIDPSRKAQEDTNVSLGPHQKDAETANAKAQARQKKGDELYKIGYASELGLHGPKNFKRALRFYKDAATHDNAAAQFRLGLIYLRSPEMDPRGKKAYRYLERAAKQGHAEAQYRLAQCYERGSGTEKNMKQARYWYAKARSQGFTVRTRP